MGKLILVSSREPYLLKRNGAGITPERIRAGLLGALEPLLPAISGHWVSWSGLEREGKSAEALPEQLEVGGAETMAQTWTLRRVPISEREASLFYYGFACRTVWPLMHLHVGRVTFDAEAWRAYRRVNQRFCAAVLEAYEPGDKVWVLDHALALVPGLLREARPDIVVAASWPIPWAPQEVVRALPWASELVRGLLGASYIGTMLPRDAAHLRAAAATVGAEDVGDDLIFEGRKVGVGAIPIGCDAATWAARGLASRGGRAIRLRRGMAAEKLALSVDRVERLRGVVERLRAVERFFDRYPSWRGRLVFCQIGVPSRTRAEDYRELKKGIDEAVARVNTRFGTAAWQPVRYLYRPFEPEELAVYYAAADVALCTPLADGMSFVPLEYAAARTRDDGALVVSSLAGAADALPEAHAVNPYDEEAVATMLHDVLAASPEETTRRMRALRDRVRRHDSRAWLTRFFHAAFGEELPEAIELPTWAGAEQLADVRSPM